MKRYIFLYLFFLFLSAIIAEGSQIKLQSEQRSLEVKQVDFTSTHIDLAFDEINFFNVETEHGTFAELFLPKGYSVGSLGTPKLPAEKKLIEIPLGADIKVKIKDYSVEEYSLSDYDITYPVMPVQPSPRKDQDINTVPFQLQANYYQKSDYIEHELVSVEDLGVLRGIRIGRLTVAPVKYNPAEETIKVYNNIQIEIQFPGADEKLTNYHRASTFSPYFEVVYNQVINPLSTKDIFDDYPDLTKYPIKMVVVSHPDFEETLQPFIEWKTIKGFEIIEAYTDDIGDSASDIKTFIHDQYNAGTPESPSPTFIVLVGDTEKLPASAIGSSSNQVTDLYYASVTDDYFPDMYLGRLSARNAEELENQIDKIIYYQKYEFDDPSFLNDITLIAGHDNFWNPRVGQPTVDYGTENYFNAVNGFINVNNYLDDYDGCYDEERIAVSLINYTAHCSPTSWGNPRLSVSDIHNMTNAGKYPLAIGNCCQSGLFSHSESIGEAWVRAENKGAVAYIGSAPNTHWFEDFYWSVGAFPIEGYNDGYVPSTEETTIGTYDAPFVSDYYAVAAKKFVGNLAITEAHLQGYNTHSNVQWYWEGYHTFGDPSTIIYLTEGKSNAVSHDPYITLGANYFIIEALPGSYAAISKDGKLHGAAFIDESGTANIPIEPIVDEGNATIVVTKPQKIPYIEEIPTTGPDGPFVILDSYFINDPGETNQANYGESFTIDITVKNVGIDPIDDVTATLQGNEDPYINLINGDNPVEFNYMGVDDSNNSSTSENAFLFEVDKNVPDQHQAKFELLITDGDKEWESNLIITANAPIFSISPDFSIFKGFISTNSKNNKQIEPGVSYSIMFEVTNHGNATAREPEIILEGNSPYFTIDDNTITASPISKNETQNAIFTFSTHPSSPDGSKVDLNIEVKDGHYYNTNSELYIGQIPEISIGNEKMTSGGYPFYNYYRANRSQMLYFSDEIGGSKKIIEKIAFSIISAFEDNNEFNNFSIKIMHTDLEEIESFADMSEGVEVFHADIYEMPTEQGLKIWELQNKFEYDGESNLLVEIHWGLLPDWTYDFYRVSCSLTEENSVAYGYSDSQANPSLSGTSKVRPNIWLAFETEESDIMDITFVVKDKDTHYPINNVALIIGSLRQYTDEAGNSLIDLAKGKYKYKFEKEDYITINDEIDVDNDKIVEVYMTHILNNVNDFSHKDNNISVYPNPAQNKVNISSERNNIKQIKIIDINGSILNNYELYSQEAEIWVNNLGSGVYLLQVKTDNDNIITKQFHIIR